VAKLKCPDATDIVGFATENGIDRIDRSEDICFLDAKDWTEEQDQEAKRYQKEFDILTKPTFKTGTINEYPPPQT
jgi:hypothetical protein